MTPSLLPIPVVPMRGVNFRRLTTLPTCIRERTR
jgi:hypothetical protein